VKDFTGNNIPSLETLQKLINDGDVSFLDKLMYFGKIVLELLHIGVIKSRVIFLD
jgi:hypothetical protein